MFLEQIRDIRNMKIHQLSLCSNIDIISSLEMFLKKFSTWGAPRYLEGKEPLWEPKIVEIFLLIFVGVLK
jgi:hypothetical protein